MLISIIESENKKDFLYLSNINDSYKLHGYSIINNKIKKLDKSFLKDLSFFKLSNNKEFVGEVDGFVAYRDEDTDFLHFFKDGKEDYQKFYLYNGSSALLSVGEITIDTPKKFNIKKTGKTIIFSSFFALLILIGAQDIKDINKSYASTNDVISTISITKNDIFNLINTSQNVTVEEKQYLYNEDFIDLILPYINNSSINILDHYKNISILKSNDTTTLGTYSPLQENIIFISNYNKNDINTFKDTISHEFIHLNQASYEYTFLNEASAEILSYEYFDNTKMNTYNDAVKEMKVLMEIIGSEEILEYNFSGNKESLNNTLSRYLTNDEKEEMYEYFRSVPSEIKSYDRLNNILDKLSFHMNGIHLYEDEVISNLLNNKDFERYYFNENKMKDEIVYFPSESYEVMSLEEAYNKNLIQFFKYTKVDLESKDDLPSGASLKANYKFNNCTLASSKTVLTSNKEELTLLEAQDKGYVTASYYYIDKTNATLEEYKNSKNNSVYIKTKNNIKSKVEGNNIKLYMKSNVISSFREKHKSNRKSK